jgi:hypothetical protein
MRNRAIVLVAVIGSAFAAGCGSNNGSGPSSGPPLEDSKTLANLSTSEMQSFCDWVAQQEGGYGRTISCDATGIPLEAPSDQTTCVSEFSQHASEPNCSATVGQWTICLQWFDANWCTTMTTTPPAECSVIQTTCYASGGSQADAGID